MTKLNLKPGDKNNRLTLIECIGQGTNGYYWWRAECECGRETKLTGTNFKGGYVKSCGCLIADTARATKTTHGRSKTLEYRIWADMISRCYLPTNTRYQDWGGRGIGVCERWRESFTAFLVDMGERPSADLSLERRDNDADYSPENCFWATRIEQGQNKRNNVRVSFNGESLTVAEASRRAGINADSVYNRVVKKDETPQRAFDHFAFGSARSPRNRLLTAAVQGNA